MSDRKTWRGCQASRFQGPKATVIGLVLLLKLMGIHWRTESTKVTGRLVFVNEPFVEEWS